MSDKDRRTPIINAMEQALAAQKQRIAALEQRLAQAEQDADARGEYADHVVAERDAIAVRAVEAIRAAAVKEGLIVEALDGSAGAEGEDGG